MEPFQDLGHAEAWNDLVEAARRYVGQELAKSSVPRKGLEDAAIEYARTMHATFGAMWNELKKALGVMGGSTDNEHRNMVKRVFALQIERDEAVRKLAVVQADSNKDLEEKRALTKVNEGKDARYAELYGSYAELERMYMDVCSALRVTKGATGKVASTTVEAIDRIIALESKNKELQGLYDAAHALNEGFVKKLAEKGNPMSREYHANCHAEMKRLGEEVIALKDRIERTSNNFANVRDALRNAENDLDYAQMKLEGH